MGSILDIVQAMEEVLVFGRYYRNNAPADTNSSIVICYLAGDPISHNEIMDQFAWENRVREIYLPLMGVAV